MAARWNAMEQVTSTS